MVSTPSLTERGIRAVIFDMDGLLLDTEALARRTWQRAARECGYDLHDALFCQLVGRTRRDSNDVLLRAFGPEFALDGFRRLCSEYWEAAMASEGVLVKSGALELLDFLDEARLLRAVATSTSRPSAMRCLTATSLAHRFDQIVTGDQIQNGKPAPDIFLAAAERLEVSPEHCLVLEDSLYGIMAAHAAGMTPIMVPDIVQPTAEILRLAHRVLSSLHEVREYLSQE